MTWPSFSALWVSKMCTEGSHAALTFKIQFLEQLTILVVPPLAHVHAERPVQARNLLRPLSHEIVRGNPSQLLPLLLLGLEALLVHTAPLPLLLDEVSAASARVWRAGPAGIVGVIRKLQFRI